MWFCKLIVRSFAYISSAAITFVLGCTAYVGLKNASNRLFLGVSEIEISLNNVELAQSRIYESSSGLLLIDTGNGDEWYANERDERTLYTCRAPQSVLLPHALYLLKDEVLPCIHYSEVKASDPHLEMNSHSIEFDSYQQRGRMRVVWVDQ